MANKVTIDVEARFIDSVTDESKSASKAVEGMGKEAEKAKKKMSNLGKTKAKPSIDVNNNAFLSKIKESERRLAKFGRSTYSAVVKVKNSEAMSGLKGIITQSKGIAGKTWKAVVKIADYATTPLQKIKNSLFSIKSLIMAITAGFATKQFVLNPINQADSYSSTKISFSTLLGEEKGQQMMDDLDEFAKKTPFKTSGVIDNAQKMMAMGWDAENIVHDMEIIGNAAAATGKLDQGLESIVRAMSQIKTKGKLSAEELNQLAEAGIAAKPMLAEALGYGTGDKALAKFSAAQEKGLIGADKALAALLEGMKKYDGMMDAMANETAEGLWSQMQDTFEINILRKWGQGLQDGAKRGLGSIVRLLDDADDALSDFGDTVYEVGKTISNWAADKLEKTVSTIQEIVKSKDFKEATLDVKLDMLWDGAIGNPFSEWWDDTVVPWWDGTAIPWLTQKAEWLGGAIGTGLTNGLLALFGASGTIIDGAEQGSSIAGALVEGFVDNFDGARITEAFVGAISNIWEALPGWAKILLGCMGANGVASVAGGVATLAGNVAKVAGSAAGTGVLGAGASTAIKLGAGNLAGSASLGAGALSALGLGSVAGGVAGAVGIGSGIKDIANGKTAQGSTKLGLVGTGALTGAAIGSAVPVVGTAAGALLGAGVGGVGALLYGNKKNKDYATGGLVRGGSQWVRVAEEGSPEMIIPLSNQRRDRGLKLWAQAGSMMGVPGFDRGLVGGGIVRGGSKLIRVAEEGSPEMIIPLSNQRRDRGLKLWAQAGSMMGVPGFARGGLTTGGYDDGLRFRRYGGDAGAGGQNVQIDIGGITFEITVHANEGQSVVEAIKAQAEEIAETVAGIMVDALGPQFENTPVRGGVA